MNPTRIIALLAGLLAACTHQAVRLDEGAAPPRDSVVLHGEIVGATELRLQAATGRIYTVRGNGRGSGERFSVVVPPGVYEVVSLDGVPPDRPLVVSGIPGDVLELGRIDLEAGRVGVRLPDTGGSIGGSLSYGWPYSGGGETPLRYYNRTGELRRPLPRSGRAGQGLGLRSR